MQIVKEFLLRTEKEEKEIDANFGNMIAQLGRMYNLPTESEREKMEVLEKTEQELRVNVGKSYSKAFTVIEVVLI